MSFDDTGRPLSPRSNNGFTWSSPSKEQEEVDPVQETHHDPEIEVSAGSSR